MTLVRHGNAQTAKCAKGDMHRVIAACTAIDASSGRYPLWLCHCGDPVRESVADVRCVGKMTQQMRRAKNCLNEFPGSRIPRYPRLTSTRLNVQSECTNIVPTFGRLLFFTVPHCACE